MKLTYYCSSSPPVFFATVGRADKLNPIKSNGIFRVEQIPVYCFSMSLPWNQGTVLGSLILPGSVKLSGRLCHQFRKISVSFSDPNSPVYENMYVRTYLTVVFNLPQVLGSGGSWDPIWGRRRGGARSRCRGLRGGTSGCSPAGVAVPSSPGRSSTRRRARPAAGRSSGWRSKPPAPGGGGAAGPSQRWPLRRPAASSAPPRPADLPNLGASPCGSSPPSSSCRSCKGFTPSAPTENVWGMQLLRGEFRNDRWIGYLKWIGA